MHCRTRPNQSHINFSSAGPFVLLALRKSNLAAALWLRDINSPLRQQSLPRADALAADACKTYPCVLVHRKTHALIPASANRAAESGRVLTAPGPPGSRIPELPGSF